MGKGEEGLRASGGGNGGRKGGSEVGKRGRVKGGKNGGELRVDKR